MESIKDRANKNIKKAIAVGLSFAVLVVGTVVSLESRPWEKEDTSKLLNPEPVVMEIETADAVIEDESSSDEDEQKKRGIFAWIKMALYAFLAGIGTFFATKVPWKKIFTKRNIIIFLVIVAVLLAYKYIWPIVEPMFNDTTK